MPVRFIVVSRTALAGLVTTALLHAVPAAAASPANAPHATPGASAPATRTAAAAAKKRPPAAPVKLVDINSAGRAELKTLPGIGDAEVDKIIAGRPFLTKAELVTKQVLPTGPFLALKGRVVAMQKTLPKAKP
jgi:DNA uptake protein ComE-like DNA-binding protein